MKFSESIKKFSDEIGGQYIDYSDSQCVVIVPVAGSRNQTVNGCIIENQLYNRKLLTLSSKVCSYQPDFDLKLVMEQTAFFNYCRFVIRDNYLQIEAVAALEGINETTLREMITEVANLADQYELKLTGKDIN